MNAPGPEGFDKSGWGDGPWQSEPDRVEFQHRGVPCLMLRAPTTGAWCGYAGVEPGHKWHGAHYFDLECEAHGGLTFADYGGERMQCYTQPTANVWWLGFDCAHAFDLMPAMRARLRGLIEYEDDETEVYRDKQYVQACTRRVADQIIAARVEPPRP